MPPPEPGRVAGKSAVGDSQRCTAERVKAVVVDAAAGTAGSIPAERAVADRRRHGKTEVVDAAAMDCRVPAQRAIANGYRGRSLVGDAAAERCPKSAVESNIAADRPVIDV